MEPTEEPLASAYERCRELHKRYGRTYYLATRLLPAWKRHHVHALYGFTRYADEIVDRTEDLPTPERARKLADWSAEFLLGLDGHPTADPLLPAVLHTIQLFDIDRDDFRCFLASMAMDLTVPEYATYADLLDYMEGSTDRAAAREPARQLGLAFQLTNFIRDVAEDLDRGRVYLPAEDLAAFDVAPVDLERARMAGRSSDKIRDLIAFVVQRARGHYRAAAPGIALLAPSSQGCIRAAYHIYGGSLDEI